MSLPACKVSARIARAQENAEQATGKPERKKPAAKKRPTRTIDKKVTQTEPQPREPDTVHESGAKAKANQQALKADRNKRVEAGGGVTAI
jgi:hypothetical protein